MTAFDRGPNGRDNRALFYGVDRIIYVEGGRDDKGAMESFDGLFWRRVFAVMRPDLRLKVLPRGGKETLLELAAQLPPGAGNVVVAMDRDYDGLFNRLIGKPSVVYTFGYSLENDIFARESLPELFYSICPICDDTVNVEPIIGELIEEYCSDVWWAQLADVCGVMLARKVIDRDHVPKYLMNSNYGVRPKLSRSAFALDVYKANSGNARERLSGVPLKKDHLPRLSVGHLYAHFCFRVVSYLHSIYSTTQKFTKDGLRATAIATCASYLAAHPDSPIATYYREALGGC